MKIYTPHPIDTSGVKLSNDILELTELLARNVHEVWAAERITQGWQWGTKRNDELRLHPCLVSYEELSNSEKEYDRNTALETLKAIQKFGYSIQKII